MYGFCAKRLIDARSSIITERRGNCVKRLADI
jgi:hypothetical protein